MRFLSAVRISFESVQLLQLFLNTNFVQTHDAMLHRTHDSEVATPGIPPENSKPVQIRLLAAIKISVIVNAR